MATSPIMLWAGAAVKPMQFAWGRGFARVMAGRLSRPWDVQEILLWPPTPGHRQRDDFCDGQILYLPTLNSHGFFGFSVF